MWVYDNSYELYHHGIKGMKWGVRRTEAQLARARGKVEKLESKLASQGGKAAAKKGIDSDKAVVKPKKKRVKDMTDDELKAYTNRLALEKSYTDALKNSRETTRGSRFVNKYLDSTIDKLADGVAADLTAQLVKAVGAKLINKGVSKFFDGSDQVFSNNKKK